ncbi:MAG: MBL fold metallo-hydrolase [Elainellaceae cyanobacterium]
MQMGPHQILLDCGLIDPLPLINKYAKDPCPADLVFCTHAHADHARGLLDLHRACPTLPIYASEVTARLLPLNWLDQEVPHFCQPLPWRSPIELKDGLTAQLWPAGHLPGAASILLTYKSRERAYTVFYTGDFLLSNSRLVEGLPLEELRGIKPDVLIVEGSYGTGRHPRRRQQENQLAEKINRALSNGQSVLLPTPTLGLAQELLMLLRSHHHFTGRDIDIWVDGSIAAGCDAYLDLLPYFPSTVQNFARHQPLFWDERIRPRVRRLQPPDRHDPQPVSLPNAPCVILTDRGSELEHYCRSDDIPWLLLLPQKPGQIGSTETSVHHAIRQSETLQTQIESNHLILDSYFLGDHCDGPSTTQLIHNIRPQHVIFIHGAPTYLADLTSLEELQNRYQLHLPSVGNRVELPIGEMFLQPAPPDAKYEGELTELETLAMLTLPDAIMSDPRWQNFADTGLVEARWQGDELVLRGLPQQEILNQGASLPLPASLECCKNCLHYRGQRCWNQASPLFGFKVTPDGYCPEFESLSSALERPRIEADD